MIEEAALFAPELLDAEVIAVLRRFVRSRRVSLKRALEALEDLVDWDVDRLPHRTLVTGAWALRDNVSAYDAFYVATATTVGAMLLTADGPLSRTPNLPVSVHNVRSS